MSDSPAVNVLNSVLTDREKADIVALHTASEPGSFARQCAEQFIKPALERINTFTGQQNDILYFAYACEFAVVSGEWK